MSSIAGRDTEEYLKILTRYDTIINQLASAKCSGVLADKLRSRQLITGAVYEEALNVGPGVVESTRIRTMINAVLAKVELNTEDYYTFMGILQEIDGIEDTVQYIEAPLQQLGLQTECAVSGPGTVTEWSANWDAAGRFIPHNSSPVNQTPSLQILTLLPVAAQWYDLGLHLGVQPDVLDAIRKISGNETELCEHMFTVWLRDDPRPTYEQLVRALAAVGKRNLAEPLLAARGIPLSVIEDIAVPQPVAKPTIPQAPPPPECVAKYAKYLKEKYKRMSVLPDGDWPPSIGRHYTRLALVANPRELLPDAEFSSTMERDYLHGKVDKIVGRKKEIQVPEIFNENPTETQLKILMDGAPGVGKTTLSRKMVCDWASGVLLEQFHLVILLHLRDPRVREAKSIKDFFPIDGPQFQQDIIQHVKDTAGEYVLFIFDAYDELSYEERTCNSLFLDIIEGRSLHNCSVLVTSRPYASDHLQQLNCINRHVEVLGFTKKQVESCIKLAIPDEEKATSLVNLLQERMDIISLCYIPLNCAIMLFVYKQKKYTLPDTLTELYEAFILNSLKQHAKSLTTIEKKQLHSATSLHGIPKSVMKQLDILSKVALEGLSEDKMVFSFSAFSDYVHVDANMEDNFLGLMTGISRTICTDYQFIHLSVQEFLAARWAAAQLVQLSHAKQVAYFQHHMKEDRFRLMLLFLAGISKLNFQNAHQILSGPIDLCRSRSFYILPRKFHFFFFILQLVFETRTLSLYHTLNIETSINGHAIDICWYKLTAFDCVLLAHFLHWSNRSWKVLNLCGCGLTDHSLEILHKVSLSQPPSTTCIEEVNLGHCSFSALPRITWFQNTSKLTISSSVDDVVHNIELNMTGLHELCIHTKDLSVGWGLQKMLTVNTGIRILNLRNSDISDHMAKSIGLGLAGNKSLRVLIIADTLFMADGAVSIFKSLEHNSSLEELILNANLCHYDEALGQALERMLRMNTGIRTLNLNGCIIYDDMAKNLALGLAGNNSLRVLEIAHNSICSDGAVSIFTSLEHNSSLEELILSGNYLKEHSEAVGQALERMLRINTGIKTLELNGCTISDDVAKNLALGLAGNKSLRVLDIGKNDIHSDGAVSIFTSLVYNTSTTLEELHLPRNSLRTVGDSAVGWALEKMLRMNIGIRTLKLNECNISDDIGKNIALGLAGNNSLRVLDIANNDIHSDGAVSIFTSLEHNTSTTLEELCLSQNSQLTVGDSEAVGWALQKMLTVNCTLKVLYLRDCGLNDVMLYHLATGLTHATCITELDISDRPTWRYNKIIDINELHAESWVHLFKALCHNSFLKKLDISRNKLGLQETEALAEMLACNKSLTELKVKECYRNRYLYKPANVHIAELAVLARGLLNNTTLQRLVVEGDPSGVKEFLTAKINITEGCRIPHLTVITEFH